jgi:aminopeptidase N
VNARKITSFDQSEFFMSAYRFSFVVSNFESIERTTQSGISLRVFANPKELLAEENAIFALEMTERVLEMLTKLFDIPFQMKALNQVALPHYDRCADAESFGIAFCREDCLLHHNNVS